jgi:ribose transport system substrate-binding protein
MFGAVTQSPLAMGVKTVEVLTQIANGEEVEDVPTEGYWYDNTNIDDESIAPNLYD